ncbi:MAG: hypothetical protein JWQ81_921 [Amycolatopsis sp.]|nr:hypothetical protein [Amycolatopsis sp.]
MRRARHTTLIELPGDTRHAATAEPAFEHPPHLRRRHRIGIETLQTTTPVSVRDVRMRSRIDQPIPIRRPPTKVTPLLARLSLHRGQHPVTRPENLTLRLRTQHRHQGPMHRTPRIHSPASFRQPHLHTLALEQSRHPHELVTVERALILADHHGVELAIGAHERRQRHRRLGSRRPRQTSRTSSVEELRHDRTPARDHALRNLTLPTTRRQAVLMLHRRRTAVKREPQAKLDSAHVWRLPSGRSLRPLNPPTESIVVILHHGHTITSVPDAFRPETRYAAFDDVGYQTHHPDGRS